MAGAEIKRPPVFRISAVQLVVLASSSVLIFVFDAVWAYSVLSGGLIAVLPQAYFAARAFRWRGARSAQAIAKSSYVGVVGKFVFSAAGFAAVFVLLRPIEGLAVFVGYLAMLMIQIFGSWLLLKNS
ncbi:MAG: ATP synthase subunit I [Proteobacteria bacterium]|nr:ATP synthase subunit I [Pseudomonadota bacterium]